MCVHASECMYKCMFRVERMCVGEHMYTCVFVCTQKSHNSSSVCLPQSNSTRLATQSVSHTLQTPPYPPNPQCWGYRYISLYPTFYGSPRDPNSGPHAHTAGTFCSESSPQACSSRKKMRQSTVSIYLWNESLSQQYV